MDYKYLSLNIKDGIAQITMSRADGTLNILNVEVINEIMECFKALNKNRDIRCIVFTSHGKSFIAGAEIDVMKDLHGNDGREFTTYGQDLMDYIENMKVPVIAAVNGFAIGGGCELAMACDIRVASTKAKFGQPETGLGILPGYGSTQRLPKLVGKGMASYLIFTGEMIDANEAYRIGLVEK